ncbi:MAG: glutamine-hydrolyzing carbamoyl-phosphate synthase small subunit [Candidatus Eremiobacteraeota bacterium]|nr:glutamine-hydrolyzing carbamoyl-phosphate synthase small subunit [Candidatus Eremiobacteraeota bacterium]MBC5826438.1 glutamine-hydrolyzing carbamoyl-phosphate synthase small subunit [Candidatus Eremiobacteraeota bacterium]
MTALRAGIFLADGSSFEGVGIGPLGISLGEAVFFTGMTGYEEALTDPSYEGQLLVFTYPLIGNYGVDASVRQHRSICAAGAVCKRFSRHPSHYRSSGSLPDWLGKSGVRSIEEVDTRAIVTRLREAGTMHAALAVGDESIAQAPFALRASAQLAEDTPALVRAVSRRSRLDLGAGPPRVALLDCGAKAGISDRLSAAGAEVVEVPFDTGPKELLGLGADGFVVSNGPGNPADLGLVIETLREVIALGTLPTFGVCLGHQLIALALGAKTYKLKYGHRGANQPVRICWSGGVMITAHNHGYAVDAASLPDGVEETMVNLNDGTNEGLRHRTLPVSSVQFHPEAAPGPGDAGYLIDDFVRSLASR